MPTVDRDAFDLFGTVYEFVGPQDMGGEGMADLLRLQERVAADPGGARPGGGEEENCSCLMSWFAACVRRRSLSSSLKFLLRWSTS